MNHAAIAANITIVKNEWGEQIIDISGKIEEGDALRVKQLSAELMLSVPAYKLKGLHYHLNTGGGDIDEAIQIGRFFREILASVDSYGNIIIGPGSEDERLLIKPDEPWRNRDYRVVPLNAPLTEENFVRNYSAGIKGEESFLQEWFIAKCGIGGDYKDVLIGKESEDFRKMEMWQIGARAKGNQPVLFLYADPNCPDAYVSALYKKIRDHNGMVAGAVRRESRGASPRASGHNLDASSGGK